MFGDAHVGVDELMEILPAANEQAESSDQLTLYLFAVHRIPMKSMNQSV